jgi:hypothetical protein
MDNDDDNTSSGANWRRYQRAKIFSDPPFFSSIPGNNNNVGGSSPGNSKSEGGPGRAVTIVINPQGDCVGGDNLAAMVGTYPKFHAHMLVKVPKIPPKHPKSDSKMLVKGPKRPR